MSIKKYTASKDNTISTAFRFNLSERASESNMGSSDILEIYNIYGQSSSSSLEQTRVLTKFPIDEIALARTAGKIPASGSIDFILRLYNAEHGQTVPEKYTLSVFPIVRDWDEGHGLDMESFLDLGPSNWVSASKGISWYATGSDYIREDYVSSSIPIPFEYKQYFDEGTEDIEINITGLVEEWIKSENKVLKHATGSIVFLENPAIDETIKIYNQDSDYRAYTFAAAGAVSGKAISVERAGTMAASLENLGIAMSANSAVTATKTGTELVIVQDNAGWYGNTIISSSILVDTASIGSFNSGSGAQNYGIVLRLSGSAEAGTTSHYTKKFFARSSQFFLKRPSIECRWDDSIKDDRYNFHVAREHYPDDVNNNKIYLYNKIGGRLMDFPAKRTPSALNLYEKLGDPAVTSQAGQASVTTEKIRTGVYSASFAYNGTANFLYDVWRLDDSARWDLANLTASLEMGYGESVRVVGAKKVDLARSQTLAMQPLDIDGNPRIWSFTPQWSSGVVTRKFPLLYLSSSAEAIFALDTTPGASSAWDNTDKVYNIAVADITHMWSAAAAAALTGAVGISPYWGTDGNGAPSGVEKSQHWATVMARLVDAINSRKTSLKITASYDSPRGYGGTITMERIEPYDRDITPVFTLLDEINVSSLWLGPDSSDVVAPPAGKQVATGTGKYLAFLSSRLSSHVFYPGQEIFGDTTSFRSSYITGSGVTIVDTAAHSTFHIPSYTVNITNLKSSYSRTESVTLRVYTRDKEWQPNVYTVASKDSPVNNIKDMFFKVKRVADDAEIIGYSTGSLPSFSSVSYDKGGSFFELDMSIFESNYLYEISFLYKDGPDYVEIKDKFKFRVD